MPASKLEILVKMLRKQIKEYSKTNQMAAKKFQEMLEETIKQYHERRKHLTLEEAGEAQELTSEQIIQNATEQALKILKDMNADRESFRKVGLTFEEKAFYGLRNLTDINLPSSVTNLLQLEQAKLPPTSFGAPLRDVKLLQSEQ